MLALKIQQAEALADGGDLYDALLDAYEPGMTVAELDPLLEGPARRPRAVRPAGARPRRSPTRRSWPARTTSGRQEQLTLRLLRDFGFDFDAGRQDISTHPFCGGPGPARRADDDAVLRLARAGRAARRRCTSAATGCTSRACPPVYARTAVAHAPSLGLHESQSRFWENVIGRSRPFWSHYLPVAKEFFPEHLADVGLDDFVRGVNAVEAGAIRVDADEVTYNLHILVRYELERELLGGRLAVADLPGGLERALHVVPRLHAEERPRGRHAGHPLGVGRDGLLRDVHARQPLLGRDRRDDARRARPGRAVARPATSSRSCSGCASASTRRAASARATT